MRSQIHVYVSRFTRIERKREKDKCYKKPASRLLTSSRVKAADYTARAFPEPDVKRRVWIPDFSGASNARLLYRSTRVGVRLN